MEWPSCQGLNRRIFKKKNGRSANAFKTTGCTEKFLMFVWDLFRFSWFGLNGVRRSRCKQPVIRQALAGRVRTCRPETQHDSTKAWQLAIGSWQLVNGERRTANGERQDHPASRTNFVRKDQGTEKTARPGAMGNLARNSEACFAVDGEYARI